MLSMLDRSLHFHMDEPTAIRVALLYWLGGIQQLWQRICLAFRSMTAMMPIAKSTCKFCYEQARVRACLSVEMIIPNCVLAACCG